MAPSVMGYDVCASLTTCATCSASTDLGLASCGWCKSSGKCVSGTNAGPSTGSCSNWVWDCDHGTACAYLNNNCAACFAASGVMCGYCAGNGQCLSKHYGYIPSGYSCPSGWHSSSCPAPAASVPASSSLSTTAKVAIAVPSAAVGPWKIWKWRLLVAAGQAAVRHAAQNGGPDNHEPATDGGYQDMGPVFPQSNCNGQRQDQEVNGGSAGIQQSNDTGMPQHDTRGSPSTYAVPGEVVAPQKEKKIIE